jgi:hypothetical protein
MKTIQVLRHQFVEYIPSPLANGVLYISTAFAIAVHKCVCGCGNEVVTPLSPTDWTLEFDGLSVSLDPSIGNWSFACQSHYWIARNRVVHAPSWSKERIASGRQRAARAAAQYYQDPGASTTDDAKEPRNRRANARKKGKGQH